MKCAVCGVEPPAARVEPLADAWGLCTTCAGRAPKRAMGCTLVCEVCDQQRLGAARRLAEWAICTPHGPRATRMVCGRCIEVARAALGPPAPAGGVRRGGR